MDQPTCILVGAGEAIAQVSLMLAAQYHSGHPRDAPIVEKEFRVKDARTLVGRIVLPALASQHPNQTPTNGGMLQEGQRSRLIWKSSNVCPDSPDQV